MTNETIDHETENALRTALSQAALSHGAPDGLHERLSAQTYRTHSTRPVLVTGLAGAAALTGVGFLATSGPAHPARSANGGGNRGQGHTPTMHLTKAQLTAEVTQAVDDESGNIFEVTTSAGSGKDSSTHWLSPDGDTLRVEIFNPDGSPLVDATYVEDGTSETVTEIDYTSRTWWTGTASVPQGFTCAQFDCSVGSSNAYSLGGPGAGMVMGAPMSSAGVTEFLDDAGFTKTGQSQTVNGVANAFSIQSPSEGDFAFAVSPNIGFEMQSPAYAELSPAPGGSGAYVGQSGITMWINPATNLPVQVVSDLSGSTITSNVSWLDPTAANEAQLTASAPAGFTQVPPPAGVTALPASTTPTTTSPTTTTPSTTPPSSTTPSSTTTTEPTTSSTTDAGNSSGD